MANNWQSLLILFLASFCVPVYATGSMDRKLVDYHDSEKVREFIEDAVRQVNARDMFLNESGIIVDIDYGETEFTWRRVDKKSGVSRTDGEDHYTLYGFMLLFGDPERLTATGLSNILDDDGKGKRYDLSQISKVIWASETESLLLVIGVENDQAYRIIRDSRKSSIPEYDWKISESAHIYTLTGWKILKKSARSESFVVSSHEISEDL